MNGCFFPAHSQVINAKQLLQPKKLSQLQIFSTQNQLLSLRETINQCLRFVKAKILVSNTRTKPVVALMSVNFPQTNNSATEEDVVMYDGPIVIEKNKNRTEVFIGLKEDAVDEIDEIFTISLKPF